MKKRWHRMCLQFSYVEYAFYIENVFLVCMIALCWDDLVKEGITHVRCMLVVCKNDWANEEIAFAQWVAMVKS